MKVSLKIENYKVIKSFTLNIFEALGNHIVAERYKFFLKSLKCYSHNIQRKAGVPMASTLVMYTPLKEVMLVKSVSPPVVVYKCRSRDLEKTVPRSSDTKMVPIPESDEEKIIFNFKSNILGGVSHY